MTTPIQVLISLHKGYGLGDAVQMSSVLRHVVAARPNWVIDYRAEEGKHQVGQGIVRSTFAYDDTYPSEHYDAEVQICLYDTWYGYKDRPNTRVSSCLKGLFDLNWKPELAQYQVNVSEFTKRWAVDTVPSDTVAIHYQGVTSKNKKDLTHEQAGRVCEDIRDFGCVPYDMGKVPMGYNAEVNCAIIQQCRAFVGIDSGPSKCASATDTPSLVVWTGHHPAPFHDPAPNTTHLVPVGYHGMVPVNNDPDVVKWFEEHYNIRQYEGDLVYEVEKWLQKTLT